MTYPCELSVKRMRMFQENFGLTEPPRHGLICLMDKTSPGKVRRSPSTAWPSRNSSCGAQYATKISPGRTVRWAADRAGAGSVMRDDLDGQLNL